MRDYIITRETENPEDELQHWQYIKKVKTKSGKWRYIYDKSELDKYNKGVTETTKSKNGDTTTTTTTKYGKTDGIFDEQSTTKYDGSLHDSKTLKRHRSIETDIVKNKANLAVHKQKLRNGFMTSF